MVNFYDKYGNLEEKRRIATIAAQMVQNDMIIGLGSGSTMQCFVEIVSKRIQEEGLSLQFVPASRKIQQFSKSYGLKLISIDDVNTFDVAFDGADRVDPQHNLIKGGGGSLFRERQILDKSEKKVILVDRSKFVPNFENEFIPIEIVPYNCHGTVKKINSLGFIGEMRGGEKPFITDNNNFIYDAKNISSLQVEVIYTNLKLQSGVVDVGLFLNKSYHVLF